MDNFSAHSELGSGLGIDFCGFNATKDMREIKMLGY